MHTTDERQIVVGDECEEGVVIKVMSKKGSSYFVWLRRPDGTIRKGRLLSIEGLTKRAAA